MAKDIGEARDAIQSRLLNLDGLIPYDVASGSEEARLSAGAIAQIFPTPTTGGFYPSTPQGIAGDELRYNFIIQLWVGLTRGLAQAQDRLDALISPMGTNANSIEGLLEDPSHAYPSDTLATLASSVVVDQFTSYGYGHLNQDPSLPPNCLTAAVPVEILVTR